jgi:DMSO/TMAO reductase YedYZ heme-binding membrane subunit
MGRLAQLVAAALLWLGLAQGASAHLSPNSVVSLDFRRNHVDAELVIPASELAYAIDGRSSARAYVLRHFGAAAADGRAWTTGLLSESRVSDAWGSDLRFRLRLTPPREADPARFRLRDDAVIEQSIGHYILVFAQSDFRGGILASNPHLLGAIQQPQTGLEIDRRGGSGGRGFAAAFALGVRHFLEGRDHQLFLVALMLPAPFLARSGRWRERKEARRTCRSLAFVITAFTIGHSLTLIGAAFLGWSLAAAIVEALIAASVLIAAVHALRPIFPGREAWIAGGFGLVHGLAFARVIADFDLDLADKVSCILGFNLGIEAIQLALAALALPPLLALARTPLYPRFRVAVGTLTAIAAACWLVERVATGGGGVEALDRLLDWTPLFILALLLVVLAARLRGQGAEVKLEIAPPVRGG